jgi:short subunit dehydrogenase-like uncharacterized protein
MCPVRFSSGLKKADYDVVVHGATGFTGQLVAEYIHKTYDGQIKWAISGRSLDKMKSLRDKMGIDVDIIVAIDKKEMTDMANSTKVVLTTVGPYQLYGNELVAACAESGTDYVDLCGEPAWMYQMINAHSATAKASGARIVFSCGFDSIPFDMGVYFLQQASLKKLGKVCSRVRGRVRAMKGTFSGGTLASLRATLSAVSHDKELLAVLKSPFALTPGFTGPDQPKGTKPIFDEPLGTWAAPFVMAAINTKNIHRSNLLLHHMYGTDFVYDEMMLTGPGEKGQAVAEKIFSSRAMETDKTQPGEGPGKEERETGYYDVLLAGETSEGETLGAIVRGDMDPGYGSTSKMVVESAMCLVLNPQLAGGGVWTCAAAMGDTLIDRLQTHAGLSFELCESTADYAKNVGKKK